MGWKCFDGVDWDERTQRAEKFLFHTKEWDDSYGENYLMGADMDYQNDIIKEDVLNWGKWIVNEIGFDGFRLDASKHVDNQMIYDFVEQTAQSTDKELFYIGEAWVNDAEVLIDYLETVGQDRLHVFDFPLRKNFIDLMHGKLDMRWLGEKGLVNKDGYGHRAITFVDNHDTDRDGDNEYGTEPIMDRKFQAYCYILMRREGVPTIYWKDYHNHGLKEKLDNLIEARKKFAHGEPYESESNDKNTYSYIRTGDDNHPGSGLVMMITQHDNGELIEKVINTGEAETLYYDYTGHVEKEVKTDQDGNGKFFVKGTMADGYSVWVKKQD